MGGDVICIDTDDDDEEAEAEDDATRAGSALGARAASRRSGARGYWRQRRRARKERKNDTTGAGGGALPWLVAGLRALTGEVVQECTDAPHLSLALRVHRLVGEFQRRGATERLPVSARQEGWRQVLRFLFHLRALAGPGGWMDEAEAGLGDGVPGEEAPTERQTGIDGANRASGKVDRHGRCHNMAPGDRRGAEQTDARQKSHRYRLTVIDILVDYVRFRCEAVVTRRPPASPAVLLRECNQIATSLFVIFGGSVELVTLTLLRTVPDRRHTLLLYPVFENILTASSTRRGSTTPASVPSYVRMLLCWKRWRSLVSGRADKAVIDAQAARLLPTRCPAVRVASDVPLLRLLAPVPPAQRANETRYLLATDLFSLEQCVAQFFRHYRRRPLAAVDDALWSNPCVPRGPRVAASRLMTELERRSNYSNVALLAELIERKGQLWARVFRAPLADRQADTGPPPPTDQHLLLEASAIVDSLRLIFRCRAEFIELTLLHVSVGGDEHAPLLGPVFEAFLTTDRRRRTSPPTSATPTGLAIYRSNDVETYARLVLCYARWKALYRRAPTEWGRIDAIALSQLPYDFPRVLCPRDARLRNVFGAGVAAPASGQHSTVTRNLIRTLPDRADLPELCLRFIEAYRCGPDAATHPTDPDTDAVRFAMTCTAAYKSMSSDRTDDGGLRAGDGPVAAVQPTSPAHSIVAGRRTEMNAIIIPDSDDGDETSASDTTIPTWAAESPPGSVPSVSGASSLPVPSPDALCSPAASGSDRSTPAAELDRIGASNTPTVGEPTAADAGVTMATPCWPSSVECFLNTPPATPQQEVVTEQWPAEEEQRRNLLVRKPPPGAGWLRLRGTVRSIGRRKKRTRADAVAIGRALGRALGDGGWWSFADVLAVRVPFALNVRWCSSIIKVATRVWPAGFAMGLHLNRAIGGVEEALKALPGGNASRELAVAMGGRRSPPDASVRSADDAILLELIAGPDGADSRTLTFDALQGSVDFAILPDNNPGRIDRCSQSGAVEDRASPSVFGLVDTCPLFAGDSDRFVHLLTALGPVSWPIG